jgi:hypothetical protein
MIYYSSWKINVSGSERKTGRDLSAHTKGKI